MAGGNHIRAVGPHAARNARPETDGEAESGATADALAPEVQDAIDLSGYEEEEAEVIDEDFETSRGRPSWLAPAAAILAVIAWTGLYGWAMRGQLAGIATTPPSAWVGWIIDWAVPVLLIAVVWLIAMRNSRAEANRFAATARLLSQESSELENRLTIVNRELSLAREFLGAQSRELESLGRIASERLSTHAEELQSLIKTNGAQVDAIGSASETALGNMTRLRDDLPVVANSARDVSNQVGNAGRTAQEQLEKLVSGFERLNDFGKASETQVQSLDKRVGIILEGFRIQIEELETAISSRLETVQEEAGSYRAQVQEAEEAALTSFSARLTTLSSEIEAVSAKLRDAEKSAFEQLIENKERFEVGVTNTVEALDRLDQQALLASQKRIKELNDEANRFDDRLELRDRNFMEEVTRRQEQFNTREAQASELLSQRLADLDDALAQRREAQTQETEKLVAQNTAMNEQLDRLNGLIEEVARHGEATRAGLEGGLSTLSAQLEEKRRELASTEAKLTELTEAGIRLLEIIQSGAKHSREDLPNAIGVASETLEAVEKRAQSLSTLMLGAGEKAEGLGDYLIEAQAKIDVADDLIGKLQAKIAEQSDDALAKIEGLRSGFHRLAQESGSFAGETQDKLRRSLEELENASQSVFKTLEEGARNKVDALASTLSERAVAELERSLRNETAETIGKLEQAAAHASGVSRESTAQLRDQLAKVNELTKNLEQRVARARELAEERVGNDFARRMALITDSLNSNSIDIANALSAEVADTSWDAYLKGDRGIFTRRALRLIDSGEAREIAELYQNDDAFKANVSRYIHDFEAMLRSMLSTRDGNALGVTILGSDIGKLYVVLAQAIERFRQ